MIYYLIWMFFLTVITVKGERCAEMMHNDYSCAGRNLTSMPPLHPDVETLDFSFNHLKTLDRMVFPLLYHLKHLDLTRCHIKNIAGDAFHNVKNLTTLILTGNPIERIGNDAFNSLYHLQKLVLADTGLLSIDELSMNNLTKLQELNVGTNHLSSMFIPHPVTNFIDFRILDLHANNISVITADQTAVLRRMRNNITIILSRNPIVHIEPRAFQSINLGELDLRATFVSVDATRNGLKALFGLNVGKLLIGHFKESFRIEKARSDFLEGLCHINFEDIYFLQIERSLTSIPIFRCMTNAIKITLVDAFLEDVEYAPFKQIRELNLKNSRLGSIPAQQLSHMRTIEKIRITDNYQPVVFLVAFEDMPLLQYVDLSNNRILLKLCCQYLFKDTPKLRYLNMSFNSEILLDYRPFIGLESIEVLDFHQTKLSPLKQTFNSVNLTYLRYLDISYTGIIFTKQMYFSGPSDLRVLKLAGNRAEGGDMIINLMFGNLTFLELLDISSCGIENLIWNSFTDMQNLRHLILNGNKLIALDFLTNPSFGALSLADFSKNHISNIPISILYTLPRNLTALDLSSNPIDCSCSQTDFILWLMKHESILVNQRNVLCLTPPASKETIVFDFDIQYCTHLWWTKLLVAIFVVVLILTLSALAYRFQFYLRYGCVLLRGYKVPRQQECHYDAFVIYSSKDEVWVEELVESLENGVPPIHLCLHGRDFEVGKSIASNIIEEGIMGSHKVIVVVSRHFIDSAWCRFEFEVAQSWLLLDGNPNIIIIILEDVEEERTKKVFGLHKYLRNNTYLKWKDNPISKVRFWARLRNAVISKTQK